MAIKINVPGYGEVEVEGAAQESTMQDILRIMETWEKNQKSQTNNNAPNSGPQREYNEVLAKAQTAMKKQLAAMGKETSEIEQHIAAYGDDAEAMQKHTDLLKKSGEALKSIGIQGLGQAISSITSVMLGYQTASKEPIQAAAAMVAGVGNMIFTATKFIIQGAAVAGEFIGSFAAGTSIAIQNAAAMGTQVVDLLQTLLTTGNQMLAQELQKRVDLFNSINAAGGSFADGMTGMTEAAMQSGIGIDVFQKAVQNAVPYVAGMGTTVGQATKILSQGFVNLSKGITNSGKSARDSLFALGYSFDQQGAVMAQYLSQQKAAGVDIFKLSQNTSALAQGTLTYAENLKVLNDLTNNQGTALLQQAQAEAQRSALEQTLSAQQKTSFEQAYATLAALPAQQGPVLQKALSQMLAGGVVTDPVVAGNAIIMDMLKKTAMQITDGNQNMVVNTQSSLSQAAQAYKASGQSATDFATLMDPTGTSGVAQGMSALGNALDQFQQGADTGAASMAAAKGQATASDGLTATYLGLQNTMTGFQTQMEGLTASYLPAYTQVMIQSTQQMTSLAETAAKLVLNVNDIMNQGLSAVLNLFGITLPSAAKDLIGGTPGDVKGDVPTDALVPVSTTVDTPKGQEITTVGQDQPADVIPSAAKGGIISPPTTATPSFDRGGIASGTTSGYSATLHGTEAVVPLPDNKSIPVTLDSSSLTAAVAQQTQTLTQILAAMNKNNNIAAGILQASQ